MSDTAMAVRDTMELDVSDVQAQVGKIQALMGSIMQEGQHYGTIPGTGDRKTLLKPGAEKLGFTFRLVPHFDVRRNDLPSGHREYEVICRLEHQVTGSFAGEGVGNCSTMETKYRYRSKNTPIGSIPDGYWDASPQQKSKMLKPGQAIKKVDGKWSLCNSERIENPDIADVYNTVLKMAKKRAHVDAMITACAASDIFTQDVEDITPEDNSTKKPSQPRGNNGNRTKGNTTTKESNNNPKIVLTDAEVAILDGMGKVLETALFTDYDRKWWHEKTKKVMGSENREKELKALRKELDEVVLEKRKTAEAVVDPDPDVEEDPSQTTLVDDPPQVTDHPDDGYADTY